MSTLPKPVYGAADAHPSISLDDVQLLAVLLCQCGVKIRPLVVANDLLTRFGSIPEISSAPPRLLSETNRISYKIALQLKSVFEASKRVGLHKLHQARCCASMSRALKEYCVTNLGYQKVEEVHTLFLTEAGKLISAEVHQKGTIDQVNIYPAEIIGRAFRLSARQFMLASSRPSRGLTVNVKDVVQARQLTHITNALDIVFRDHLLVSKSKIVSMKLQRLF